MNDNKPILRYNANERTNHWIVAILFILAGLSGLALFHPALFWLSHLFGGGYRVFGIRVGHGLHDDGRAATDLYPVDMDPGAGTAGFGFRGARADLFFGHSGAF